MAADYYDLLGIPRNASSEDVRRAFRRLAKQHHPDVNRDDPDADARFKAINEAYEVLRDPQKRQVYDRFGADALRGGGVGRGGPVYGDFVSEMFEQFFGFGARPRGQRVSRAERGGDVQLHLRLSFAEAVFGVSRSITVARREMCEACDGSGAARGTRPQTCATCGGSGEVRRVHQSLLTSLVNVVPCPDCRGRGQVIAEPCPECRGEGRVRRERNLEVDIPAGVAEGMQVRLAGEGDHGRFGGPPGDLFVILEVDPHPHFMRQDDDVHLQLRLNPADAALGAEVAVPTLEGQTVLRIPSGTQSGDTFRLPQLGVPHLRQVGRGDQVVTVFVVTPQRLTREQRELLEQLRASLPTAEVVEHKGGFWDRVRERFT